MEIIRGLRLPLPIIFTNQTAFIDPCHTRQGGTGTWQHHDAFPAAAATSTSPASNSASRSVISLYNTLTARKFSARPITGAHALTRPI